MTGAGSGQVAIAVEDSFQTLPGVPTWFQPGEALEASDATLDRQLIDNPQADDPRGDAAVAGNIRGSFSLSFTYAGTDWHELVFPETDGSGNPVSLAPGGGVTAPTATIYLRTKAPEGTQERFLSGAAVESFTLNYQEGDVVTVDLSFVYFDEPEVGGTHGSAPADGSINSPAKDEIVTGAGFDLEVGSGGSVSNLQSATVELGGMASERSQQAQQPTDVVVGDYDQTGNITAIISDNTLRQRTYGSSTAVEPLSDVNETTVTVTCEAKNGTTETYDLTRVQPDTTNWQNVAAGEQTTNPTSIQFHDMTVV